MKKLQLAYDVVSAYSRGDSAQQIADACGCSQWAVQDRLKKAGIVSRRVGPQRRYTLDEHFFDVIDIEAKAYWLGFLLADGSVTHKNDQWITRVELATVDEDHLRKLAAAVATDSPLVRRSSGKAATRLLLCSAIMGRSLTAIGCTPNKTGVHVTPKVPADLQHHMYRGYFDGDGSLFQTTKGGSWSFDVVGSPQFIEEFQRWLMVRVGVNQTKLVMHRLVISLRYQGGQQVQQICDELYRDATIYLDRKFDRYRSLLARRTDRGPRPS